MLTYGFLDIKTVCAGTTGHRLCGLNAVFKWYNIFSPTFSRNVKSVLGNIHNPRGKSTGVKQSGPIFSRIKGSQVLSKTPQK